mmetsp:Transcript_97610/g.304071  ORF Transcript_97610/g.304071 Transcript_97610/m.304071 type:complete len:347 (-) Transcript_97610:40-1080(-)|eukprot:CAMPEP_0204593136 /NCGR_PEP_ID=MMETSP0661-20131031/51336_1 /ASSEMBLY_ACC=CAM_ASM_000606 /TAXON_ID=109239 /ORGANISM="Alexandrium margalefi, Strain AMGDE01CS-322" /LENGTH=346 /DNA_ID=CAMNT_0051603421 /DNA_START=53 /DNA_END=1093 /DNA_ORIENTATION=-
MASRLAALLLLIAASPECSSASRMKVSRQAEASDLRALEGSFYADALSGLGHPDLSAPDERIEDLVEAYDGSDGNQLYRAVLGARAGKSLSDAEYAAARKKRIELITSAYEDFIKPACKEGQDGCQPLAFFLTGLSAVGKTSYINKHMDLPEHVVHVNSDDIRAALLGNFAIFKTVERKNVLGKNVMDDAWHVKVAVLKRAREAKGNFLSDSYSADYKDDVKPCLEAGFKVHFVYFEAGCGRAVPECSFDAKLEETRRRVLARASHPDGHYVSFLWSSWVTGHYVAQQREKMILQARAARKDSGTPVFFKISQDMNWDDAGELADQPYPVTPSDSMPPLKPAAGAR